MNGKYTLLDEVIIYFLAIDVLENLQLKSSKFDPQGPWFTGVSPGFFDGGGGSTLPFPCPYP